ncbi:zinc finger Y-chromosomal protein-like [Homalodisca vitripennis]|uniref:zinc finger Y-chromosomal protein-like n=1 Tax=Homalodisca vitripennis TaxID=197043 RepID=UPI001EEB5C76|nr:zinc finger Y-chromosomal protein-like [Homalodisca vitripennis]
MKTQNRQVCEFCNKQFASFSNRNKHIKNIHMKTADDEPKIKLLCTQCGMQFSAKSSLQRHMDTVHSFESAKCYYCHKCTFKTLRLYSLQRHILGVHDSGKDQLKTLPNPFKCSICGVQFQYSTSLKRHEKKTHKIGDVPSRQIKIKCPVCSFTACGIGCVKSIHDHFKNVHSIEITKENLYFDSLEKFYTWKKDTEKKTTSFFCKAYSNSRMLLYRCHRCGMYRKRGTNKRKPKTKGSCKMNAFCPARIKVKVLENQSVNVIYISNHVGHENELKHLHLTKEDRSKTVTTVVTKDSCKKVFKRVKNALTKRSKPNKSKRIQLMNESNTVTTEKAVTLNNELNQPNFLSIAAWIQEFNMAEEIVLLVNGEEETEEHLVVELIDEDPTCIGEIILD